MGLFKCLLIFISILATFASNEPLHSEEQHEDAFHSLLTAMEFTNDTLQAEDVTSILTKLRVNCSNTTQHKHKCVTAKTLFKIFNISTSSSIGEEVFSKFAPIIVYALLPKEEHLKKPTEQHAHDDDDHDDDDHDDDHDDEESHDEKSDSEAEITQNVNVYNELLERYETTELCEQIFDQLLKDVNETTGVLLGGDKCFSSQDILHQLNVSSDTETGESLFPEINVIILSKLIQKQCIEIRYKSPLPCPSYFANHLFEEYAENDVISEKKMEELLKKLKIGKHVDDHDEKDRVDNDEHNHRSRRSLIVPKGPLGSQIFGKPLGLQKRYRRETDEHGNDHETEKYQKCYSVDELFAIYKVNKETGFKLEKFQRLSSALVHQIESKVCAVDAHEDHSNGVSEAEKWGYSILAVAIISLCSVLGVAIIPFMKTIFYQKAVVFLISLAVGTLVGDALLHLFPHAIGFHNAEGHNHGSGSDESEERHYLWKFLLASAAIYGFFLFETLTHLFLRKPIGHSHSVEHTRRHSQFAEHEHNVTEEIAVESSPQNKNTPVVLTNLAYISNEELENQTSDKDTTGKDKTVVIGENGSGDNSYIKEKKEVKKTISSVAWNIIIGDTIHNVADGIAIGVAFSDSISGGVSTAIAVFCHELPHELGDFAVLLSAGMSVKKALLANFLSACSCFIGLVFGILISEIEDVNLWIFAATAGFFIYIALTNMLPELMHSAEFNMISKLAMFSLQNLGILTGFSFMFLLSFYEEDINI